MSSPKRKLGLSVKLLIACIVLAFLCMAGGIYVLKLHPPPPWAGDVERACMIGSWVFLVLGVLLKGAISLFYKPD